MLHGSTTYAQVSLYSFSQSQQTYQEITAADGGYQLGTPTFSPPQHNLRAYVDPALPEGTITNGGYLSPAIGPGYPIGFNFLFNGDVFDRIGVANGGWISFGKSTDANQAVWCFTSDHPHGRPLLQSIGGPAISYQRNRIAGFGRSNLRAQDESSVGGPTSSLRVATIGTAPNRVCVIQWKDFRTNYSVDNNRVSFQIRLNESDNSVDVRFGPMQWNWYQGGAGSAQVGLGGRNNTDFNNRMTVYEEPGFDHDWNATVPGTTNISACIAGNPSAPQSEGPGVLPVVGLNFKWSAPTCPPPAWPLVVSQVTYNSATVSWTAMPGAASYDYVITTSSDPDDPDPVASGNTTQSSFQVNGLEPLTNYFIHVRSRCGANAGIWGAPTPFRSEGGGVLQCGDAPLQESYCWLAVDRVVWYYSTSDDVSPIRLTLTGGALPPGGELAIFYGPDTLGTPAWSSTSSVILGTILTSPGPNVTIRLRTSGTASCANTSFLEAVEWTIGCKDCAEPLAALSMVNEDCENQQYEVQVLLVSMGSSANVLISNSQGVAATTVSATGLYTVGPFAAGTAVVITLENPDNALCNVESVPFLNAPCAAVSCGPDDYTYCYGVNESSQWLYQGEGEPIGIRFRSGTLNQFAAGKVYNGLDPFSVANTPLPNALANKMYVSTNVDNALLLELTSQQFQSCQDGFSTPWDYVVACHDGCSQPSATFSVVEDCVNGQFFVEVAVTELGSTGSVLITNDGGAPALTATVVGPYSVGPFASLAQVTIEVEGASVLCSWTSPKQSFDCSSINIGMAEHSTRMLRTYPNPSNGEFRIVVPASASGALYVEVRDLSGRIVHRGSEAAVQQGELLLDLAHLPSGLYVAILVAGNESFLARLDLSN